MIAQLESTVARPEIAWDGLLPILTLGVGALLLVLFRSLMKQLPKAAADQAVPVIGGLTVVAMWVVGGIAGTDVPLAGLRDDLGDPLFFLGLLIVIGLAGWFAQYLRLSVDAALTVMIGLTSLAATWGVWTDRYEVDGAFGLVGDQLGADGFSLVITGVIAGAIVLVALLLDDYLEREGMAGAEMYVLMLFSGAGGAVMASANDLIVLFLALETLSIAVYVMAAMHMRRSESQEAGLKYFVLGAFSSAFLLYGIALTYGAVGSTNLIVIADFLEQNRLVENGLLMAGMAMLLVGLGFKVAAARSTPGRPTSTRVRHPGGGLHGLGGQGGRLCGAGPGLRDDVRRPRRRLAACGLRPGDPHPRGRLVHGDRAARREAHARLLLDQPRRLHPGRCPGRLGRRHLVGAVLCRRLHLPRDRQLRRVEHRVGRG